MPSIPTLRVGQYELYGVIGSGGMATVHLGRLQGAGGFARVVAIKRLQPHVAQKRELANRFLDEARIVARMHHSGVVQTLDVVFDGDEALIIMEYVPGETLGRLLQVSCRTGDQLQPGVASAILAGALHGLHAAHEARDEAGEPLGIVHRDVSPQNILVGTDGIARILDFGVAKATAFTSITPGGQLKGKLAYMAPEQLAGHDATPRSDLFAAAICLWECLVGRRLFLDESEAKTLANISTMEIPPPSAFVPGLPAELDQMVLRGLERDPERRFASARDMATALEQAVPPASAEVVADWVYRHAREALQVRAELLVEVESSPSATIPPVEALRGAPTEPASATRKGSRGGAPRTIWWLGGLATTASAALLFSLIVSERKTPAPAIAAAVPPTPSAEVEVQAPPEMTSAAAPTRIDHVLRTRAHTARSAPQAGPQTCSPPFTYNAAGHKVFKPECL